MKRFCQLVFLAACSVLSACALWQNDRAYVWDSEYQWVRDVYDRCGSVAVVEDLLRERKWTTGKINEVVYRLSKDYSLDEKGQPRGIDRPRPIVSTRQLDEMGIGPNRPMSSRLGSRY